MRATRLIPLLFAKTSVAIFIFALALALTSPVSIAGEPAVSRIGKEVVFAEGDSSLQKHLYQRMGLKPGFPPSLPYALPYVDYVGKTGKVLDIVKPSSSSSPWTYWKIQLETGETIYAERIGPSEGQIDGMYFVEDYEAAKRKIGEFIWINQAEWKARKQRLVKEDPDVSYPVAHLEKVKVVGVFTRHLGHSYGAAPFFIKVEKANGETGLIGYNPKNYFERYPIEETWDPKIKDAIRNQNLLLGMTADQVVLSRGRPQKTNCSVTVSGTKEQWVYDGPVLYLEDNKLTSFQEEK
jgi:hypothetical protein